MYSAIVLGLTRVSDRYRDLIQALKSHGCHLACCTVYRPNFDHLFFKSLAVCSLGLHNARIRQISADLDTSIIDLANMFDGKEDFANPLELSTLGGSKLVENIAAFVSEHQPVTMVKHRNKFNYLYTEEDDAFGSNNDFGMSLRCCTTRVSRRKIYCSKQVTKPVTKPAEQPNRNGSNLNIAPRAPLKFAEAQERWRRT